MTETLALHMLELKKSVRFLERRTLKYGSMTDTLSFRAEMKKELARLRTKYQVKE